MRLKISPLLIAPVIISLLWYCTPPKKNEQVKIQPVAADSGTLIIMQGNDTTRFQQFFIHGDSFLTRILDKSGKVGFATCSGNLTPEGRISNIRLNRYFPADGSWRTAHKALLNFVNDSLIVHLDSITRVIKGSYDDHYPELNFIQSVCFMPFPFLGFSLSGHLSDTIPENLVQIKTPSLISIDEYGKGNIMSPLKPEGGYILYIQKDRKLDSLRGTGSSAGIHGFVTRNFNFDSLLFNSLPKIKIETKSRLVSRDTLNFSNGSLLIKIKYTRATINTSINNEDSIPFGAAWIPGSNIPIEFTTNRQITFYGQPLGKGRYSLLTIPQPDYWLLVISTKNDVTVKNYDPGNDVMRVPMKLDSLPDTVNRFTIGLSPVDSGGLMTFKWKKSMASIDFK